MNVIQESRKSRFLTKQDVGDGLVLTIDEVSKENVSPNGKEPDERCVLYFENSLKPLVLNSTNAQAIADLLGTEESDEWHGKEIELYHDPKIVFGGKRIGGIRVRAPI
jgi:hypothetical protein